MASKFDPVCTLAQLALLDAEEMKLGYLAGVYGQELVLDCTSKSFFHGWRNGRVDAGYAEIDFAQIALLDELAALRQRSKH